MKTQKLTFDQLHQDLEVLDSKNLNGIKGGSATNLTEQVLNVYAPSSTPDLIWLDQLDTSGMIYTANPAPDPVWPDSAAFYFFNEGGELPLNQPGEFTGMINTSFTLTTGDDIQALFRSKLIMNQYPSENLTIE